MPQTVNFDLTEQAFVEDPYPFYRDLRENGALHWHKNGFWMVMRYADSIAMLQDPRFIRPPRKSQEELDRLFENEELSPAAFLNSYGILWQNPPDHTRLRRLFTKAFTPRVVDSLRPNIRDNTHRLLDAAEDKGQLELIDDLAHPLPILVIMEMLGVPRSDREQLRLWGQNLIATFDPFLGDEKVQARGNEAIGKFMDYFRSLINRRQAEPRDDLLSSMISVQAEGERLSERELLANAIFLFVAGHETTTGLLGNGMLALLRNQEELNKLSKDFDLIDEAVEELLRYDSSQQTIFWTVSETVDWNGHEISPGDLVIIMVGSANRDPVQFSKPDKLNIKRLNNRHLAFSHGIHYCLGAPLARAHAQIALPAILERFPNVSLSDKPKWQKTIFIRELRKLEINLGI